MEGLFTRIIEMNVTAACIFAVILILRFFMKKLPAKYSYMLWAVLFIRLVMPFSVSSAVSMFNLIPDTDVFFADSAQPQASRIHEAPSVPGEQSRTDMPHNDAPSADVRNITADHDREETPQTRSVSWKEICAYIWLTGIAVIAAYSAVCMIRLKKALAGAERQLDRICFL